MAIKINPWIKTTLVATLGGGLSSAFAAMVNHDKYHFPQDIGSGKLWEYFIYGAVMTFAAVCVRSPIEPPVPPPCDEPRNGTDTKP